jgi:hypothetical protein
MSDNEDNQIARARAPDHSGDAEVREHDPESWAWLICVRVEDVPAWMFPHDVLDLCAHCSAPVQFRPNSPARPSRVCLQCALDLLRAGRG